MGEQCSLQGIAEKTLGGNSIAVAGRGMDESIKCFFGETHILNEEEPEDPDKIHKDNLTTSKMHQAQVDVEYTNYNTEIYKSTNVNKKTEYDKIVKNVENIAKKIKDILVKVEDFKIKAQTVNNENFTFIKII